MENKGMNKHVAFGVVGVVVGALAVFFLMPPKEVEKVVEVEKIVEKIVERPAAPKVAEKPAANAMEIVVWAPEDQNERYRFEAVAPPFSTRS